MGDNTLVLVGGLLWFLRCLQMSLHKKTSSLIHFSPACPHKYKTTMCVRDSLNTLGTVGDEWTAPAVTNSPIDFFSHSLIIDVRIDVSVDAVSSLLDFHLHFDRRPQIKTNAWPPTCLTAPQPNPASQGPTVTALINDIHLA